MIHSPWLLLAPHSPAGTAYRPQWMKRPNLALLNQANFSARGGSAACAAAATLNPVARNNPNRPAAPTAGTLRSDNDGMIAVRSCCDGRHRMDEKLRNISQLVAMLEGKPKTLKAGDVLFEQGQPGTQMFVVQSGSLELRVNGNVVGSVGPGGVIGEMAIVDRGPRSATAVA